MVAITANGDTAVACHVNAMLLDHSTTLLWGEAGEGEHTDLSGDVRPVAWHADAFNGAS